MIENYVETGNDTHPSKVDIGPINTILTANFIDGFRTRLSGQTTAKLNPHWFLGGYVARGWGSKKNYYKAELTYSFNKKEFLPHEFPKQTLTFTSTYDITSPSDKFIHTDKDNVFSALKWAKVDKMMFYNRQKLSFEREEEWGFKTTASLKTEENEACAALFFSPLSSGKTIPHVNDDRLKDYLHNGKIRTTEAYLEFQIAPGRTYINTKQRRRKVNREAPIITLGHTMGIKGFLGGEYDYHYSELSVKQRIWLSSWGKLDVYVKGGVQWSRVPYPLLCMPEHACQ